MLKSRPLLNLKLAKPKTFIHSNLIWKTGGSMTFNYADLTPQHFVASINWIWKMSAPSKWNLTPEEIAILIGMNVREYLEIQKMANEDRSFLLQPDVAERLSLLLGIWKRLQLMGFSDDTAIAVFNRKNNGELLNGKSIKSFLLESSSLAEYYAVNLYLELNSRI